MYACWCRQMGVLMKKNNYMGRVWLVGAGPSDIGLFTLRGKEVLEQAQVVVYDRLVGAGILSLIPEQARCIDVGKQAGDHTMSQEQINELLLEEAKNGKRVVRLKGGDPFLFGRGGEELALLSKHGVPFEVVPGVTSAISVPAYSGIPVTHRDCASSLHIITGHRKAEEASELDFEALVRTGGTLVFLMGYLALADICQGLLKFGMNPDMPAALLQQGTTAGQKKIIATVATLNEAVSKETTEPPAIIVIGKVCSYESEFSWYEKLPLFGNKIIVTRPKERSSVLTGKLRNLGAEVLELPAIKTVPIKENPLFLKEIGKLSEYNYLVFTSPAGVNIFFDTLKQKKKDIRSIGKGKIAVIGPGTRAELEKRGLIPDLMPASFDGRELGIMLGTTLKNGDKILISRAKEGNPEIIREIEKRKSVTIVDLPIYETVYECRESLFDQKSLFESGKISMAIFTSASTVLGFEKCNPKLNYSLVRAVCIGKQTRQKAEELGMKTYMAKEATIGSLVELAVELAERSRR